jgi:hypothetical protein
MIEHMSAMRKFQHQITVLGAKAPAQGTFVSAAYHPPSAPMVAHHVTFSPMGSFVGGALSFDLFPTTTDLLRKIERDGVRSDWQKVGSDLRKSMKPSSANIYARALAHD